MVRQLVPNYSNWFVTVCTFENTPSRIPTSPAVSNSPDDLGAYVLPETIRNDRMCGWKQLTGDDFDWTRQRGSTPSSQTGPDGDKTNGRGRNFKKCWYINVKKLFHSFGLKSKKRFSFEFLSLK